MVDRYVHIIIAFMNALQINLQLYLKKYVISKLHNFILTNILLIVIFLARPVHLTRKMQDKSLIQYLLGNYGTLTQDIQLLYFS